MTLPALVDTGATRSFVDKETAARLRSIEQKPRDLKPRRVIRVNAETLICRRARLPIYSETDWFRFRGSERGFFISPGTFFLLLWIVRARKKDGILDYKTARCLHIRVHSVFSLTLRAIESDVSLRDGFGAIRSGFCSVGRFSHFSRILNTERLSGVG